MSQNEVAVVDKVTAQNREADLLETKMIERLLAKEEAYASRARIVNLARLNGPQVFAHLKHNFLQIPDEERQEHISRYRGLARSIVMAPSESFRVGMLEAYSEVFNEQEDSEWVGKKLTEAILMAREHLTEENDQLIDIYSRSFVALKKIGGSQNLETAEAISYQLQRVMTNRMVKKSFTSTYVQSAMRISLVCSPRESSFYFLFFPAKMLIECVTELYRLNKHELCEIIIHDSWDEICNGTDTSTKEAFLLMVLEHFPSQNILTKILNELTQSRPLASIASGYLDRRQKDAFVSVVTAFPEVAESVSVIESVRNSNDPELVQRYLQEPKDAYEILEYAADCIESGRYADALKVIRDNNHSIENANESLFRVGLKKVISELKNNPLLDDAVRRIFITQLIQLVFSHASSDGISDLLKNSGPLGLSTSDVDQLKLELTMQLADILPNDVTGVSFSRLYDLSDQSIVQKMQQVLPDSALETVKSSLREEANRLVLRITESPGEIKLADQVGIILEICVMVHDVATAMMVLEAVRSSGSFLLLKKTTSFLDSLILLGASEVCSDVATTILKSGSGMPSHSLIAALLTVGAREQAGEVGDLLLEKYRSSDQFVYYIQLYLQPLIEEGYGDYALAQLQRFKNFSNQDVENIVQHILNTSENRDFVQQVCELFSQSGFAQNYPRNYMSILLKFGLIDQAISFFSSNIVSFHELSSQDFFQQLCRLAAENPGNDYTDRLKQILSGLDELSQPDAMAQLASVVAIKELDDWSLNDTTELDDMLLAQDVIAFAHKQVADNIQHQRLLSLLFNMGLLKDRLPPPLQNQVRNSMNQIISRSMKDAYSTLLPQTSVDIFSLPLQWERMKKIWDAPFYSRFNLTACNLAKIVELENVSPGITEQLADSKTANIASFARYPTETLLGMRANNTTKIGALYFQDDDSNGFLYEVGAELDKLTISSRQEDICPYIFEFDSLYDLFRRFVAVRAFARAGKPNAYSIVATHGHTAGVRLSDGSVVSAALLSKPMPGTENEVLEVTKRTRGELWHSVEAFIQLLKPEVFPPSSPIAIISCNQGHEGGLADRLSEVLATKVTAGDGLVILESLDLLKHSDGSYSIDAKFESAPTMQYQSGNLILVS